VRNIKNTQIEKHFLQHTAENYYKTKATEKICNCNRNNRQRIKKIHYFSQIHLLAQSQTCKN
jgi:hypothetical protein